jgi:DNA-directed RNA polymerase subunit beta'
MSNPATDKLKPKTRITSTNIEELIENYIKTGQLNLYDYVIFIHPKKTNNKEIVTTFARVLFNSVLPEDYPFINETVTGKKFEQILKDIEQKYGLETENEVIKRAQKYFLYLSSLTTPTFDVSKLEIPEEILKKRDEIVSQIDNMSPVEFDQKVYELYKELEKFLEEKGITFFDLVKSGTKGKASDLIQLFLVWGYGIDADGNLTPPVRHSLFEGMQPEELYYGSNKARFAGYLKSVGSGEPGYLAVKLRYALNDLYVSKKTRDCK